MKDVDYKKVLELYNEILSGGRFLPCHCLTDRRREVIDDFVRQYGEDNFHIFFERIKQSTHGNGPTITLSDILDYGIPGYIMRWAPSRDIAMNKLIRWLEGAEQWEIERLLSLARSFWNHLTFLPLSNYKEVFGPHFINRVEFERNRKTMKLDSVYIDGIKYKLVMEGGGVS